MPPHARPRPKHLAAKLLAIRQHLQLSESQLAKRLELKLSPCRISKYEHAAKEPNLMVLLRYSEIAGVHMETLVNDQIDLTRFRDALLVMQRSKL